MEERIFNALGDPMRRRLVKTLAEQSPKTATQLAQEFPMISRQGIIKHLELLAEAGLVEKRPKGREKRYSLTPAPLQNVSEWIQAISAIWDERLLRLKNLLEMENEDS